MKVPSIFKTSDLYLAAALKVSGFRLLNIQKNNTGKGTFFFEDRDDRTKFVKDYFGGEIQGSLKAFASAWGDLKSLLNQIDIDESSEPVVVVHRRS